MVWVEVEVGVATNPHSFMFVVDKLGLKSYHSSVGLWNVYMLVIPLSHRRKGLQLECSMKWVSDVTPLAACDPTLHALSTPRLSWFFITSTIPVTNVSFQYPITRSRGYRRTTGPSAKVQHAFSCPYNWSGQCGKDNHPSASLRYNRTAKNFQSGGSSGI